MNTPLPKSFYHRNPQRVARQLLGKFLVRKLTGQLGTTLLVGRIVETEAYLAANDPACHASRGISRRNATMFGPPGLAYVYAIHSRYCLNAVTQAEGKPSAILIRAVEPLAGLSQMALHRQITWPINPTEDSPNPQTEPTLPTPESATTAKKGAQTAKKSARMAQMRAHSMPLRQLTSGPGRLCQALAIDRQFDSVDLTQSTLLWITDTFGHWPASNAQEKQSIAISPRIGVTSGKDLLLRYYLAGNPFVSGTLKFNQAWSTKPAAHSPAPPRPPHT